MAPASQLLGRQGSSGSLTSSPQATLLVVAAPDGGYREAGDDTLIERYEAAKAVPAERRSYDVAAFVHTYELLGDVAQTLPWIVETPPAPPPLPNDVLSACLLKYLKATSTFVNSPAYPGAWVLRIMAQLYPLWVARVALPDSPSGPPSGSGQPGPAFDAATDPSIPLAAEPGGSLLLPLLRVLCLGDLLPSTPCLRQDALHIFEKVHASLRTPSQAAQLRNELAALGQGPIADGGISGDRPVGAASSGSSRGSTNIHTSSEGGKPIMTFEELECYTLWKLVNKLTQLAEDLGPCNEAPALLARGRAAAQHMIAITPEDPTAQYALVKIHQALGERHEELAGLQRSLALSEAQGNQYNIIVGGTSTGHCAVQVFKERCKQDLAGRPSARDKECQRLAQLLAALLAKARTAYRAVKGLLPEPAMAVVRSHRRFLRHMTQYYAGGGASSEGLTPGQRERARVPRDLHCDKCGRLALSAKACGGCRRVYYCSKECQRQHWRSGHREECQK
ncbi:hypothetical protein N2152v2_008178 [Parachlorella kessleri]